MGKILDFYLGKGTDNRGRYISDVWSFDADELETCHNYIQWLFPLQEPSQAVPGSPVLTDAEVEAFQNSTELQSNLLQSLNHMLDFYGLKLSAGQVVRSYSFDECSASWKCQRDHNQLRLTRIIKSLKLLGLPSYAKALQKCLLQEGKDIVNPTTFHFWRLAV